MLAKHALDDVAKPVLSLHRRVAKVETRLELPGDHVRSAGTRVQVRHLERRGLKVLRSLVPHAGRQLGERRCKCVNRVFSEMRVGYVSLNAMDGEPSTEGPAAAHLDGVANGLLARRLADDAPVDPLFSGGEGLDHTLRAVDGRSFLIARDQESDRALVLGMGGNELLGSRHHGGQAALHVRGAAAEQKPVPDGGLKRIRAPLFERARWDHVGVPSETEHRSAGAVRRPEVLHAAVAQALDSEAGRLEPPDHDFLATFIRRGHGPPGHQILSQLKGLRHRSGRGPE